MVSIISKIFHFATLLHMLRLRKMNKIKKVYRWLAIIVTIGVIASFFSKKIYYSCEALLYGLVKILPTDTNHVNERIYLSDIDMFKKTKAYPLAKCVQYEDIAGMRSFLNDHKELIDFPDSRFGYTVLMWAIFNKRYEAAIELLQYGADPNLVSKKYGDTPLTILLENESDSKLKYKLFLKLLQSGANPNKTLIPQLCV